MMIGDVIEAINGVSIGTQFEVSNQKWPNLVTTDHWKSVEMIKAAGKELELLIRRGNRTVPRV